MTATSQLPLQYTRPSLPTPPPSAFLSFHSVSYFQFLCNVLLPLPQKCPPHHRCHTRRSLTVTIAWTGWMFGVGLGTLGIERIDLSGNKKYK